ncbi:MAG: type II/IV secretion system ATPase subunit [Chloroflexi bacterium]|nr:type II/IV secretion system ATPase subunit [Chloroflexota bacterium]
MGPAHHPDQQGARLTTMAAQTRLPFDFTPGTKLTSREDLLVIMSPELRTACETSGFLFEYLQYVPLAEYGIPQYFAKVPRTLDTSFFRNIIYPIKDGLYVHIYPDHLGARDHYIAVEPTIVTPIAHLVTEVDNKLISWAEEIGRTESEDAKKKLLVELVEQICTTEAPKPKPDGSRAKQTKVLVSPAELEALKYWVIREKVGLGILQPLLLDPYLEDISCSGTGSIFIEHKIFKSVQSSIVFATLDDVDDFVIWLGEWIKSPVTVRNPLVDAVLPDGSRINIVYGREISKRGSNFTIRKFSGTPTSIVELIDFGTLNYMMAAYLSLVIESHLNVFVVGATASGKTTLLNAVTTFIRPEAKIVTIEDTPEVQVPHENWLQETTRVASGEKKGSDVGMFELLRAALRQRPDMIIVGEIRGVEAVVAFQAMQTGHGVMSTFHASSVEKLIQRLTGDPINIPKTYIDNLSLAIIMSAVRLADGRSARRVLSINEIIGYDPATESFSFLEAFRWNVATDTFEFAGLHSSYLLEEIISLKRGIPPHRRREIYNEVKWRAKVFEQLHREKKVTDFNEFFKILAEARRQQYL